MKAFLPGDRVVVLLPDGSFEAGIVLGSIKNTIRVKLKDREIVRNRRFMQAEAGFCNFGGFRYRIVPVTASSCTLSQQPGEE